MQQIITTVLYACIYILYRYNSCICLYSYIPYINRAVCRLWRQSQPKLDIKLNLISQNSIPLNYFVQITTLYILHSSQYLNIKCSQKGIYVLELWSYTIDILKEAFKY